MPMNTDLAIVVFAPTGTGILLGVSGVTTIV
jgi:hypothetical protein